MTDKEFRETRKRIDRAVEKWRHILWLSQWQLDLTYCRETPDDMRAESAAYAIYMDVEPQWHYMTAVIRFNMPQCALLAPADLERHIVHELMHCVVHEMHMWRPNRREHEERVVTHLTKAIIAAEITGRDDGMAEMKRQQRKRGDG